MKHVGRRRITKQLNAFSCLLLYLTLSNFEFMVSCSFFDMNPEILHHHPSAEEILFETYAVASAADSRYFTHRHSDIGEMFLTGNYGGCQQFFANDVFETVVSLDFTKFDEFSGQSAISASVFSIKDKGLVSFFNINRFEYEKFTYGLMLEFSSSNPIKELVHSEGSGAWGDFLDSESPVRQSVLNWLNSLSP